MKKRDAAISSFFKTWHCLTKNFDFLELFTDVQLSASEFQQICQVQSSVAPCSAQSFLFDMGFVN